MLVTGGTGLLGWSLVNRLVERGFEVYATYHATRPPVAEGVKWVWVDFDDPHEARPLVESLRPEVVVHAAAYTDVDGCEANKLLALNVNYVSTRELATACRGVCKYFVYISTDYVFDGEKGLYREGDPPNPLNYYGLTKLMGEIAVAANLEYYLVLRTSGLYGCSPGGKRGFALDALGKLSRGQVVEAFVDQFLSPTYAPDLADAITRLLEGRPRGFLHVAGERVSRYEFAVELARVLGVSEDLVKPTSIASAVLRARRPRDSSLDSSLARSMGVGVRPLREALRAFAGECVDYAR
ncbi:dTDP-4-dehydrorhamnose reductase [Thermogladius calderae]|uniref:dTDP-4-dehydrorhamnose reductase n=1 Tax=Thermogladius calderae TaxID=1200300 RepID=UPI001EE6397E|nr:dTDP-4-dehydrorhamnose reductase [Thermogladius calderae]